jgi:hypothetical protein
MRGSILWKALGRSPSTSAHPAATPPPVRDFCSSPAPARSESPKGRPPSPRSKSPPGGTAWHSSSRAPPLPVPLGAPLARPPDAQVANANCNLWSEPGQRCGILGGVRPGRRSGAASGLRGSPGTGWRGRSDTGSGGKRLRQQPPLTPSLPLSLRFPLPFLQKSIPRGGGGGGGGEGGAGLARGGAALSAVLTPWSSLRCRLQPCVVLPPLLSA